MLEFRSGGRRVSQDEFFRNLEQQAVNLGLKELEDRIFGAASSIIDPETGKGADVFVRRNAEHGLLIRTKGSPHFARELERRLGLDEGTVKSERQSSNAGQPRVYLAHASEDHEAMAKPLAEYLMGQGIDVWLDAWEIRAGDSLKQKMEEGLAGCTHFLILLTRNSLHKRWVQTEIDAGFVRMVEGESRFIGVRVDLAVNELSPFLKTLHCPEIHISEAEDMARLAADIYGVSRKPARGDAPQYAKSVPEGLRAWSPAAVRVAEYLVRHSEHAGDFDPEVEVVEISKETGLPEEDVRLGVLDLKDAGLIEETKVLARDSFWPKRSLFVEFDRHFMEFNNEQDAIAIANWLISERREEASAEEIVSQFSSWRPRRLNSALAYLEEAKAIEALRFLDGSPLILSIATVTDRTRRFVRNHG